MFKFILLAILIVSIMFFFEIILPKIKIKYRLKKEIKESEERRKRFAQKMKELEIK